MESEEGLYEAGAPREQQAERRRSGRVLPKRKKREEKRREGKKEEGKGRGKEEPAVGKSQSVTIFFSLLSISLAWLASFQLRHVPVHFAVHGLDPALSI